jgi:hypothetical protein
MPNNASQYFPYDNDYFQGIHFTNGDFETDISGWITYKDTGATPQDGIGGSPTLTIERTAIALLGNGSGLITKASSNQQGEGVSYDFSIDPGVLTGQPLQLSFFYNSSVNYVSGDIGVYILDKTSGLTLSTSTVNLLSMNTQNGEFQMSFLPTTSTQYRLCFHVQVATTTSFTLKIDKVRIKDTPVLVGAAIGNWNNFTPTLSYEVNGGTAPTYGLLTGRWRRVGSNIECIVVVNWTNVGSGNAGYIRINLPTGYSTDLTVLSGQGRTNAVGYWSCTSSIANTTLQGIMCHYGPTDFVLPRHPGGALPGNGDLRIDSSGYTAMVQTGYNYTFVFTLPISQWGSNINLATDFTEYVSNSSTADSNDSTSFAYGSAGSRIPSFTSSRSRRVRFQKPILPTDKLVIETSSSDGAQWYDIAYEASDSTNYAIGTFTTQGSYFYGIGRLNKISSTDIDVTFGHYSNLGSIYGGAGGTWSSPYSQSIKWRIRKISNGNMAEVPTIVKATYKTALGQSITNGSVVVVNFDTKVQDSHNAVTTGVGVWKFTAPIAGRYSIKGAVLSQTRSFSSGVYGIAYPFINGTNINQVLFRKVGPALSEYMDFQFNIDVDLNQGEYVNIRMDSGVQTTYNLHTDNSYNWITITRIGN